MTISEHCSDNDVLSAIQLLLNGQEWSADTVQEIAETMQRAGWRIDDLNEAIECSR